MTQFFRNERGISKKPERGVFPLDHHGQCDDFLITYMNCVSQNNGWVTICRQESKNFFKCRVRNNLMRQDDFNALGYSMDDRVIEEAFYMSKVDNSHEAGFAPKEETGFIAGIEFKEEEKFKKIVVRPRTTIDISEELLGTQYIEDNLDILPPPIPEGYELF